MPMGGIKILNGRQFQSGVVDVLAERSQFFVRPQSVGIAGQSPAGIITDRLIPGLVVARRAEVIDEMNDQVGAAALSGEAVMLRVKLMAIEAKSQFHGPAIRFWNRWPMLCR